MSHKLAKFNPFNELVRFDALRNFDDLLRGFHMRPGSDDPTDAGIRLDIKENANDYQINADLPGVKKEDIDIEIEGNRVTLAARVQREKEDKQGDYLYTERYWGEQKRSFTLGHELDSARTKAQFQDGVLALTVPKKPSNGSSKRIAIE